MRYTLEEIETFLTVMELGTVTAAASRLNLSKSVVSKRIADLEVSLGAALFRRNAGRIVATDAAYPLADRLRSALSELRAAAESVAWTMDGPRVLRGRLKISLPMSFGRAYMGPVLTSFAADNPELELLIDYDDRSRDLAAEGIDVAIRIGKLRDTALKARKLCEDRMIACASPDYLARFGEPKTLDDLQAHQVIGYTNVANARAWELSGKGRAVALPSRITTNSGDAIRDFVIAGLGLAIVPGFIAAEAIADGRLVPVLTKLAPQRLQVSVVWPPVSPMPAKLRAFIDHIAKAFSQGFPWMRDQDQA